MFSPPDRSQVQGNRFRRRRMSRFLRLAEAVAAGGRPCRILDLGGDTSYWEALRPMWSHLPLAITLVNVLELEPVPGPYRILQGNACSLPELADGAFDLVHSNSVIEHVGEWSGQRRMAAEVSRLAPSFFVQTPNFWFPLELHTRVPVMHWLPRPWQRTLLMRRACGFYERAGSVDEAEEILADVRLLDRASMQWLFPDATILRERWGPWTKSLIAIRDRTGSASAAA